MNFESIKLVLTQNLKVLEDQVQAGSVPPMESDVV
jgi:hypothetical protein